MQRFRAAGPGCLEFRRGTQAGEGGYDARLGPRRIRTLPRRTVTKVIPSRIPALKTAQIAELADVLRLLGEASRLSILLACIEGPASVGEITRRVGISRSLVSHHLRLLKASRFLRATRDGKRIIYAPVDDNVRCILADLVTQIIAPRPAKERD